MQDDTVSRSSKKAGYINGFSDAMLICFIAGAVGTALYFAHQWGTSRSMDALEPKPQVTVLVAPVTPSPFVTATPGPKDEN
jgi:hypothetical protein